MIQPPPLFIQKYNAFCGTLQYFYINYPKHVITATSIIYISFKRCSYRHNQEIQTRPAIGKIMLNGSPEGLANTLYGLIEEKNFFIGVVL